MAHLTIYKDHRTDITAVPNYFIDEYIEDANDAQLKVYLYLLRMLNADRAVTVSDIADKFNHTEKDVLRALKHWEKKHILSLDYDDAGNLTGIRLHELTPADTASAKKEDNLSAIPEKTITPAASVSVPPVFAKPAYTAAQLRAFHEKEETAQLFFIAQSYLGRPLSAAEMKSLLFMVDVLHFSDDLIDHLIQYCVDRGKTDFKYIEKVAVNWAEQGITTPQQAQEVSARYDKNVYAIMNQLGKSGSPTAKELEFINRWTKEYGFSNDVIFEACERTVLATDKHRFEYADSILNKWKQENVHAKSDILRIDRIYQSRKRTSPKPASVNKFNQFSQNEYDFDQLERELLSN